MIRYLYEHQDLISDLDYIGFCHYRRYFGFRNELPKLGVKRVLNEGSTDQSLYNQWLDIQETIGAEQFLDCIWNWLGDTDLKAIVSYAIEDGYISDPAEEDDEDWDDDDF